MVIILASVVGIGRVRPASFEREESDVATAGEPFPVGADREGPEPGLLPLQVGLVGVRDLGGLRRLDTLYRLDQPESHLAPYSPLRAGLAASLPGFRGRRPAFVARAGDRLVGVAQFRPLAPDGRWLLIALGASVGVFDPDPVWEALLSNGVRGAGLRGVKRLYARVPRGLPIAPVLRRLGWSPYATETVYVAQGGVKRSRRGSGERATAVRPQRPADTWAIHQLYNAAVPRSVQEAEAHTSHRWELGAPGPAPAGAAVAGWLIEDGHDLIGYARTASRGDVHVLELVYHPERRGVLDDLLAGTLAALGDAPRRRIYCAVRGYQAEAATALEGRGFAPSLEQDLSVKYTTVAVRLPATETVAFHVEVRDKLPQRVPSFLHGRPSDESAT